MADVYDLNLNTIGQRIAAIRRRKHMRANELASAAGISPQTLSSIENGNSTPNLYTLCSISVVLECSLSELQPRDLDPYEATIPELAPAMRKIAKMSLKKKKEMIRMISAMVDASDSA